MSRSALQIENRHLLQATSGLEHGEELYGDEENAQDNEGGKVEADCEEVHEDVAQVGLVVAAELQASLARRFLAAERAGRVQTVQLVLDAPLVSGQTQADLGVELRLGEHFGGKRKI